MDFSDNLLHTHSSVESYNTSPVERENGRLGNPMHSCVIHGARLCYSSGRPYTIIDELFETGNVELREMHLIFTVAIL